MNELDEVANRLLRLTQAQEQREKLREQLRDTESVLRTVYLAGSLPAAKRLIRNWLVDQKVRGKPTTLDFEQQDKLVAYNSWVEDTVVLLRQYCQEHLSRSDTGLCSCGMCERYEELIAKAKQLTKSTT